MKNYYYLLGIQSYANHDSGASIIKVSKNLKKIDYVAISEERLLRKKYPYTFPLHSINYCMEFFGIKRFRDIDYIISDWIRIKRWIRSGPAYNYQMYDYIKEKLDFEKKKIIQIDHHLAHAASTYYTNSYNKSAILIVDGNGSDLETNSFFLGNKNKIRLLRKFKYHGIGAAYTAVSKSILNFGTGGEGKTMGLAPYGKPNKKIKINFSLKNINTDFSKFMRRMPYSDVLNHTNDKFRPKLIKQKYPSANSKNIMNSIFCDWAYKIQKVTEDVMVHLGKEIFKLTKSKNICLAGGVALNSVANYQLLKKTKFKNMFVFPACSDAGIPFGLVLWGYHNILNGKKRVKFNNAFTGIDYSKKKIIKLLKKNNIKFEITKPKKIAELISKGHVIGNFFGKSEYGPRALGNRSILADPRNKKMRDYINIKVKHREIFRPFAPAVLQEKSKNYFDVSHSPYMLQVAKSKKSSKIPSAVHVDNTARLQTVNKKENKNFYSLIKEFYKITNVPILLNTSFNDKGEPLVEKPIDALICFLKTDLDYLVLEDLLICKKNIKKINKTINYLSRNRKNEIDRNEKKIIKKITRNFSLHEFKERKKKENNLAKSYVLLRPFSKIKHFLKNHKKQKKTLLVIGSEDHTKIMIKLFKNDFKNFKFISIKKNDLKLNKFSKIKFKKIDKKKFYHKIFISSFEYIDEIKEKFNLKNYFTPYDNSSRSIIDYYLIKKFKDVNKINSL